MNRYGKFNLGSVQSQSVNHESQASNSTESINPYFRRDSLSHEPNMEYSQMSSGFSRISGGATRAGSSFPGKSKLQSSTSSDDDLKLNEEESGRNQFLSTELTLCSWNKSKRKSNNQEPNMDFQKSSGFNHTLVATQKKKSSEKLQLSCDSDDSKNIIIQNFIHTLQGCTYWNNIELDKEDSSNQLEFLKLTLALPIPKDNTHIQNENTSISIERDQPNRSRLYHKESLETILEKIGNQYQVVPNYTEEPNMDFQKSSGFNHTLVATQKKKSSEKLQLSCDNDDSEDINIRNFIHTLQGCTYWNNIELDKEDSSNQLESLKLTLALPILKDNTHIQNENTSTSIERDQPKRSRLYHKEGLETILEKIGNQDQVVPNYTEVDNEAFDTLND